MGGMIVHKLTAVPAEGAWGAGQGAGPASAPLSDKVQGHSRERPGEDEGWGGGAQWGRSGGHGIVMMMKNVLVFNLYTTTLVVLSQRKGPWGSLCVCGHQTRHHSSAKLSSGKPRLLRYSRVAPRER